MPKGGSSRGGARGLLGFRRNPNCQLLFGLHTNDYPSDDSSDSDYDPGEGTSQQNLSTGDSDGDNKSKSVTAKRKSKSPGKKVTPKKQKLEKETSKTPTKKQKRKLSTKSDADDKNAVKTGGNISSHEDVYQSTLWSQVIPDEVLLKIFSYAVRDEGAIPLLYRVSCVCHKWNRVSSELSLWKFVDLSAYGKIGKDSLLESLVKSKLSRLERIDLDEWKDLTILGINVLVLNCPYIRSISLSGCEKLYCNSIQLIAKNCPNLTSIDLSFIQNDAASNASILYLLIHTAHQLTELHLRKCRRLGNTALTAIQGNCKQLRELDLSGTSLTSLHIEKLQAGCPKLRKLHLASLIIRTVSSSRKAKQASKGFPDLEFLSICSFGGGVGLDDDFLLRLLKTSSKLKVLDMRGCTKITRKGLEGIPCTSLEHLYISRSMPFLGTIDTIIAKWGSCLKTLKMARNSFPFNLADLAMNYVANAKVLEILDLESTTVSSIGVRVVLAGCKNLKQLNLTGCRGIPRGVKRSHDKNGIDLLRKNIDNWSVINEDS